ncbi:carboxymuconolactone decarboxylase family protein [Nocardia anaemiae]|uniref:carboxymuconolactone decarboxylase family protein n=1 Tax=Nocardia anaemiae TaxID=263910 RepID=UPI0007A4AC69|nr:carboxymuconolactone decarboxylase family protein [Nocardia anaemiae]
MWLDAVESGQELPARIMFATMRRLGRTEVPAVVKVICYRHRYFGTPLSDLIQDAMRGPSFWSVAEREIFATRASQSNECPFCVSAHHGIAGAYIAGNLVDAALADGDNSPLRPEARAMLEFVGKMVRDPDGLTPGDADKVRAAGVTAEAFDEAVWVATLFNVINRVMNTVGAEALEASQAQIGARFIKAFGYRTPPPVRYLSRGA